jgi:prepilin-type N-terminal cleavage/methylation domain-containing protein
MGTRPSRGFTVIELLVVVAIIGVVSSIAIPALLSARRSANQAAAVASLRALYSAQRAYASTCAHDLYASRLSQLSHPPRTGGEPFLSPDLTGGDVVVKSGYRVVLAEGSDGVRGSEAACNGVDPEDLFTSFFATAAPVSPGSSGDFFYWMGTAGAIYLDESPIRSSEGNQPPPEGHTLDRPKAGKSGALPESHP